MFAVLHERSAGGPPFSGTHEFRLEGFARFDRYFADIHLIAGNALLCVGLLKDQPLTIVTEIGLSIIAPEGELADIAEMGFIGIGQGIL